MSKKHQGILTLYEVASYLRLPPSTAYKLAKVADYPARNAADNDGFVK